MPTVRSNRIISYSPATVAKVVETHMPAYGPRQKVETTETHQTGGHLDEGMSLQLLKSQSPLGNKSTRPSSAASSPSPKGGRIDASEKASSTTTLGNLLPFGATDSSPTSPVITDAHLSKDDGDQKKKAPSTHEEEGEQLCSSGIFLFCFRVCRPISCSCTATGGAMKDPPLKKVEETTETQNQPGDIRQLFKSPQSPLGNESTRPSTKTEECVRGTEQSKRNGLAVMRDVPIRQRKEEFVLVTVPR